MPENKYCKYCLPTKNRNHVAEHLEYFISKLTHGLEWLIKKLISEYKFQKISHLFSIVLIKTLSSIGLATHEYEPEGSKLRNRTLIFFKQGQQLGLDLSAVKVLGCYNGEFRLKYEEKTYYYPAVPAKIKDFEAKEGLMDDKLKFKRFLNKHDFSAPKGDSCFNFQQAKKVVGEIGFPVVTKPAQGSLSVHISLNIDSEKKLKQGFKIAKQYKPEVMVEEFIPGDLYRATTIEQQEVFVCQKEPANVVGDGSSTIAELIKQKNSDPLRGEAKQKNTTLHQIPINDLLKKNLKQKNLNLESIPKSEEKIYLHNKVILSQGCDIINKTKQAHPEVKSMFLNLSQKLQTNLVGFDFICSDISKAPNQQEFAIIEANSLPYIDMHAFPSHGEAEPIAEITWQKVLNRLKT
ncbi:MAG: hypothetical protein ABEJ02_04520 [Candidatus Paceibacteria bacterium]